MRYRLAVLMPLAVVPVMNLMAAPAPDPYGVLDIGSPPKGMTAEQHLKVQVEFKISPYMLNTVCSYPEVKKLPAVAALKDARTWMAKNFRGTPEKGDRLLRFTFGAGKRTEQVTIINAFLRASLHWNDLDGKAIKRSEECLHSFERNILELEKRIESEKDPQYVDSYREGINELRNTRIPELRAEIARMKQYAVIRWAR